MAPIYTYSPLGLSISSDPQAGSYGREGGRSSTTTGVRTGINMLSHTHNNHMI
jgi:hypothetical protein